MQRCQLEQRWAEPTEEELAEKEKKLAKGIEEEPPEDVFAKNKTYVYVRIKITPAIFPMVE